MPLLHYSRTATIMLNFREESVFHKIYFLRSLIDYLLSKLAMLVAQATTCCNYSYMHPVCCVAKNYQLRFSLEVWRDSFWKRVVKSGRVCSHKMSLKSNFHFLKEKLFYLRHISTDYCY